MSEQSAQKAKITFGQKVKNKIIEIDPYFGKIFGEYSAFGQRMFTGKTTHEEVLVNSDIDLKVENQSIVRNIFDSMKVVHTFRPWRARKPGKLNGFVAVAKTIPYLIYGTVLTTMQFAALISCVTLVPAAFAVVETVKYVAHVATALPDHIAKKLIMFVNDIALLRNPFKNLFAIHDHNWVGEEGKNGHKDFDYSISVGIELMERGNIAQKALGFVLFAVAIPTSLIKFIADVVIHWVAKIQNGVSNGIKFIVESYAKSAYKIKGVKVEMFQSSEAGQGQGTTPPVQPTTLAQPNSLAAGEVEAQKQDPVVKTAASTDVTTNVQAATTTSTEASIASNLGVASSQTVAETAKTASVRKPEGSTSSVQLTTLAQPISPSAGEVKAQANDPQKQASAAKTVENNVAKTNTQTATTTSTKASVATNLGVASSQIVAEVAKTASVRETEELPAVSGSSNEQHVGVFRKDTDNKGQGQGAKPSVQPTTLAQPNSLSAGEVKAEAKDDDEKQASVERAALRAKRIETQNNERVRLLNARNGINNGSDQVSREKTVSTTSNPTSVLATPSDRTSTVESEKKVVSNQL